jgi:hypothetical protein
VEAPKEESSQEETSQEECSQEDRLDPSELYEERCKKCAMCVKPDCGRCATCVLNASRGLRVRQVCLHKMCTEISQEQKQQRADGFPTGWCFIFDNPNEEDDSFVDDKFRRPDLSGLRMISPNGHKYRTIGAVRRKYQGSLDPFEDRIHRLFAQIGVSLWLKNSEHALLGKSYCREWMNVEGQRRIVYGCITKVEDSPLHDPKFTITFNDDSRAIVNNLYEGGNSSLSVPATSTITESLAWGGSILYDAKNNFRGVPARNDSADSEPPFYTSWIVPDLAAEEIDYERNPQGLPKLTLTIGGFQLEFITKPSTIPNAGYGVFVRCTSLNTSDSRSQHLELKPGELVDFGIYAPFRAQDTKKEHIFLLKTFAYKYSCEEYCFDTSVESDEEEIFDISDDWTGELHADARRHVPAYVNEISDENQRACVHALFGCEGALHYLIGHAHEGDGPFQLAADGREQEIFIDYGPRYEKVRIRRNYSRLADKERERAVDNLKEDDFEYLQEILSFTPGEVESAVQFFRGIIMDGRHLEHDFVMRSLMLAILLKKRARAIMPEVAEEEEPSFCNDGATELDLSKLAGDAGGLVSRLFDRWNNDKVMKQRLLNSAAFTSILQEVIGRTDLAALNPREFRGLIDEI